MTDVIVLHRIPGARPGAILPLDERMQRHVDAGNAAVLPAGQDVWADEPTDDAPLPVLTGTSTGAYVEDEDSELEDSDGDSETVD